MEQARERALVRCSGTIEATSELTGQGTRWQTKLVKNYLADL